MAVSVRRAPPRRAQRDLRWCARREMGSVWEEIARQRDGAGVGNRATRGFAGSRRPWTRQRSV